MLQHLEAVLMYGAPEEQSPIPHHSLQQRRICRHIRQEVGHIVDQSNESLDVMIASWRVPIPYPLQFIHVWVYSIVIDGVSQALYLFSIQNAFGLFEVELVFSQALKHDPVSPLLVLNRHGIDEYIIQVNVHESSDYIAKYRGHQPLECHKGIAVPLLHHIAHIGPHDCCEGHLVNVLWFNVNLFVCICQVDFQPVLGSRHIFTNDILIWQGRYVLDCVSFC